MVNYHDSGGGHSDLWDYIEALSADLAEAKERIEALDKRVRSLEADTPEARQAQHELDVTLADNAAAGFGPADDYMSYQCRDRYHERCPPDVRCECQCHFEDEEG
jgi:hypothetical protein